MSETVAPRKLGGQFVVDAEYREILAELAADPKALESYIGQMKAELYVLRFAAQEGIRLRLPVDVRPSDARFIYDEACWVATAREAVVAS